MKIGILRETIRIDDKRVAITPFFARMLLNKFPKVQLKVQPSNKRIFANHDYINYGIEINEDISDCDLIIGVKEVDVNSIIYGKKYMFFAHVAKQQAHNKTYFKQLAKKRITLLDYEYFTNNEGKRITAFGQWAGNIGVYNSIVAIGKRTNSFHIPPAIELKNYREMLDILSNIKLPALKFMITGNGFTAKGTADTLLKIGIQQVDLNDFLNTEYNSSVFCQLTSDYYIQRNDDLSFNKQEYYQSPHLYKSIFNTIVTKADIYISCHYWDKKFPIYLSADDLKNTQSKLKIVADISCDLKGPIACSIRESTLNHPFYDYNPQTQKEEKPFSSLSNINVMAVDNLPAALPSDSSSYFSKVLVQEILPKIINNETSQSINRATILENGELTSHFLYLYDFLNSID